MVDRRGGARQIADVQKSDIDRAWKELLEYAGTLMGSTGHREPIVPGLAIGVVWLPEKLVYGRGFGVRKVGGLEPVEGPNEVGPSTVFPLASLSKPISSTVMAMAMNEHAGLAWSDHVSGLGSYRELFAHRSGLPDHAGDLLEDLGQLRAEILQQLLLLARNPVGAYAYTNFGLTAAAEHAAQRIGTPWEQLAAQLYAKLGMRDTSSLFNVFEGNRLHRTWGHVWRDGGWQHEVQRNPDQQSPAGGVTSTIDDLSKWMQLQLGAQTWGEFPGLDVTHTPYEGDEGYALGWNAKTRWTSGKKREVLELGHSGAFDLGAGTSVKLWPPDQLGIVVLTNAAPIGVAEALCAAFGQLVCAPEQTAARLLVEPLPSRVRPERELPLLENVQEFMHWSLVAPRRSNAVPAPGKPAVRSDSPFQGKYADEFHGEVELDVQDGRLVMHMGPGGRERFVASATDEPNVFVYDSRGEFGATNNRVEFHKGDVDTVGIWNLLLTYPQELARDSDTRCPLSGVIRLWKVYAKRPARLALTVSRDQVPGFRTSPPADVYVGWNWFADAGLDVLAGDMVGFSIDGVYSQVATEEFEVSFDIDRQGTFVRCREPAW